MEFPNLTTIYHQQYSINLPSFHISVGGSFIHSTSSISSMQFIYCHGTTQRHVMLLFICSSSSGIFLFIQDMGVVSSAMVVLFLHQIRGYQKIEKPKPKSPINENEIQITTQCMIRNYITLATSLLQAPTSQKFVYSSICCMF